MSGGIFAWLITSVTGIFEMRLAKFACIFLLLSAVRQKRPVCPFLRKLLTPSKGQTSSNPSACWDVPSSLWRSKAGPKNEPIAISIRLWNELNDNRASGVSYLGIISKAGTTRASFRLISRSFSIDCWIFESNRFDSFIAAS